MNEYPTYSNRPDQPDGFDQPSSPVLDLRRERLQVSSIALAITFITLATLLLRFVLELIVQLVFPALAEQGWYEMVSSMLPMHLIAMPLSYLIYRFGTASPPKPKKINLAVWLALLTVTLAVTYIGNFIGIAVNTLIGLITGEPVQNGLQELTGQTPFWANLLFVGILAPILEEIFYRKLVIDRLRRYGDLTAVLVSGTLFGLLHGNFSQFFYAAMGGILFGYIYLYTGKLRYTIALHMTVNLLGGVLVPTIANRIDVEALQSGSAEALLNNLLPLATLGGYLMLAFACIILAPIVIVLLRKHIRFASGEIKLTCKDFFKIFLLNPTVWILLILTVVSFILSI